MTATPFRRPEVRVALWCLVWLVLCMGAAEGLLRADVPWRFSSLEPHVLRSKRDAYGHNAFEIQRVKRGDRAGEAVVLLGGSTGLLALQSDEAFGEQLGAELGLPVDFHSLCATYQVFTDDAQIARELGAFGGTLVLALDPLRFTKSVEQQLVYTDREGNPVRKYYFLTPGPEVSRVLTVHGSSVSIAERVLLVRCSVGLGGMEKKKFRELIREGTYTRNTFDRLYISREIPADAQRLEEIRGMLTDKIADYERWHPLNFALLEAIVAAAVADGNRVVLLDLPHNPVFDEEFAALAPGYDRDIAQLVQRHGIGHVDLRDAAPWSRKDFRDAHHLCSSGRKKFASALAEDLPPELDSR